MIATIAMAAAGVTALAGCGSSGSGSKSNAPTSPSQHAAGQQSSQAASGSGGSTQSAAGLVPAAIKSKGTLTVATDATYPPDEFVDPGSKTIIGMDADLAKALGDQLGVKLNLINATFDTIIPGLQSGKYDMGLSSFTDTKKREQVVDFVVYYKTGESFFVNSSSTRSFDGLDSLCGAKVTVENGTTEQSDAQAQSKKCVADGKKPVTVLTFGDQNGANLAVANGRADVGFADSQVVGYMLTQSHGQFKATGNPVNVTPSGIALPKGNGMAPAVQAAVKNLIADGTYEKIFTKWGMQTNIIPADDVKINAAVS
jgi:polar amino acid transport system substrate-binding protein